MSRTSASDTSEVDVLGEAATSLVVDLRSDTVTSPDSVMRRAMAEAAVGDDVYGEDPTVNELERVAAEMLGKEAALLVTSGTQGNLIALLTQTERGDEIICGSASHTFFYEGGGSAALGGIHPRTLPNQHDGTLALDDIVDAIRASDDHQPPTRLVCLENTFGGRPLSLEYLMQVAELAEGHGLLLHLDGARIFNASVALDVPVSDLVVPFQTVSFCLSKGLGAPVGSILCGSTQAITQARRWRKMLGGGMRQAGVLAAAGLVALERAAELEHDHRRARELARGLEESVGLRVVGCYTNMVFADVPAEWYPQFHKDVAQRGVRIPSGQVIDGFLRTRLVLHRDIDDAGVARAIEELAGAATLRRHQTDDRTKAPVRVE